MTDLQSRDGAGQAVPILYQLRSTVHGFHILFTRRLERLYIMDQGGGSYGAWDRGRMIAQASDLHLGARACALFASGKSVENKLRRGEVGESTELSFCLISFHFQIIRLF